jgi:ankyrin repeat protein
VTDPDSANQSLVEYLVSKGANPWFQFSDTNHARNLTDLNVLRSTGSALHMLPMSKAAEPLLAFLQTLPGFDVDAKNSSGDTIAHISASRSHKDLIKLLVEAGADFSLTNNSGKIPVAMATLRDDLERFIEHTKSQMASGGGKRKASEALEGESEAKKMKIVRCVWCLFCEG